MGMTGSGKSSLIALCTNEQVEIGHDLQSCTQDVRTYSFRHPKLRSGRIHLVDTPGFDDTNRSDTEILRTLAAWLTRTYSNGVKLSGILYLHRINQPRMQGSALKNISLFRSLCGDDALKKVVLVTTMWDITENDIAESREKQLKNMRKYWGGMIAKGSQLIHHDNTRKSALALFNAFMEADEKITLKIQSEMVNGNKSLEGTDAGNDIKEMLAEQNARLKKERQDLETEFREALKKRDEELADALEELRRENEQALRQVLDSHQRLQVTVQQLQESEAAKSKGRPKKVHDSYFSEDGFPGSASIVAALSPTQPLDTSMKVLSKATLREGSRVNVKPGFEISPDESYMGFIFYRPRSKDYVALISMESGEEFRRYDRVENEAYDSKLCGPITFSSDRQTLVTRGFYGIFKSQRDPPCLKLWRELTQFYANAGKGLTSFSANLELIATREDCSISLALSSERFVLMRSEAVRGTLHWPIFGKNAEILISWTSRELRCWNIERQYGWKIKECFLRHLPAMVNCTISGDSLWLAATTERNGDLAGDRELEMETSIFQLSGECPEFVTKLDTTIKNKPSSAFDFSLSFNGAYFSCTNEIEAVIFHVITGKAVWREGNFKDKQMKFFPSSNRFLIFDYPNRTYCIWGIGS
ncbi:hypothetical protein RRF57_011129 [Xylaria bambusicola]|uniref:G domain-containing protein n=1 Tax=Xylaria bambusicola TaxID=326684 RepID=A0AAN7Z9G1_9PEZI